MINVPLEANGFDIDEVSLACPECGSSYLHHGAAITWDRKYEDAPTGTITTTNAGAITVQSEHSMDNCPSSRRDAIQIEFVCESCHGFENTRKPFLLNIIQHKGNTFLQWRKQDDKVNTTETGVPESVQRTTRGGCQACEKQCCST